MSRYVIVSMPASAPSPVDRMTGTARRDGASVASGCAWLFTAAPNVDDPESALRAAVAAYFSSPEGEGVRRGEGLDALGWCDAIPWIPDELWARHGLTALRHPDVERIVLDADEDLAEELPGAPTSRVRGASTR